MREIIEYLREFNLVSATLRLLLAALGGFAVGFGRSRKQRNAGMRTYMIVCIGAALTILISMYEYEMIRGQWAWASARGELKFDGTRFAAQVIAGIGFLAAGTILSVAHQQISGLTSAIGMQRIEVGLKRQMHHITISVEFSSIEDIETITDTVQKLDARIFELEIERSEPSDGQLPSAILSMKLAKHQSSHSAMLSSVAELPCVCAVRELIVRRLDRSGAFL